MFDVHSKYFFLYMHLKNYYLIQVMHCVLSIQGSSEIPFREIPLRRTKNEPMSLSEILTDALHSPMIDGSNLIGSVKSMPLSTVACWTAEVPASVPFSK